MAQKRPRAKRSIKELKNTKKVQEAGIHVVMPFLMGIVALFIAFCLFLPSKSGFIGGGVSAVLKGLFSLGAYLLPVLLMVQAIFYRRDLKCGSHLYKCWFSLGDMLFLGALWGMLRNKEPNFEILTNWKQGVALTGGGLLGGYLHKSLDFLLQWFSPVVAVLALVIFSTFLVGATPADLIRKVFLPLWEKFREGHRERRDRRAEEKEAREAARLRLAEERAEEEKWKFKEEKKQKKSGKCAVNMETGEVISEPVPEDLVKDDEVEIALRDREAEWAKAQEEAKKREIIPIEEMESEPVPSLDQEVHQVFFGEETPTPVTDDFAEDQLDLRQALAEKHGEDFSLEKTDVFAQEEETTKEEYRFPPATILQAAPPASAGSRVEQEATAEKLVECLKSFGVNTSLSGIAKGPAVTRYELQPQRGVRVRSIVNLTDDIALAMAAGGVRIEAPIPGKEAVGIEVPNKERDTVFVRELIERREFTENPSRLNCALGRDVAGNHIYCDLAKMPHILIAGATGMGKSVCLNSMIVSMLYHATPEEVQLILIDPKKVEMSKYNGIPHLLVPVVSDSKKAAGALNWAVIEMEKRFIELEEVGVRDMKSYNELTKNDPDRRRMPHIVIIIDELADLMMTAKAEVETSICRLAQKARAAGLHLVIGTQRPSVDVITGLIKANVPSRIACTVASQVDSRTIIDIIGAEKLLGKGDMLYAPVGSSKPLRVQGAFVSDSEVEAVCDYIRSQRCAEYDEAVSNLIEREAQKCGEKKKGGFFSDEEENLTSVGLFADKDPLLEKAIDVAVTEKKVSTSLLQRKLSVGYARAAKLIDFMAEMNVVGEYAGSKPREVLWTEQYYAEYKMRALEDHAID